MEQKRRHINKYASIMHRLSHTYFDIELEGYGIGCGQQFFLMRIEEAPGISLLSLAQKGYFDKGTTTRAVKKLEELGYVRRITDEKDKRINRLYVTDEAGPVLEEIRAMLEKWYEILTTGLTEQQRNTVETIMGTMVENACQHIDQRRKSERRTECTECTRERGEPHDEE